MNRVGVLRCLAAAALFGATAPAASELAGTVPAFTLAGLLYLGAAVAVLPATAVHRPDRTALAREWRPVTVAVVAGGMAGPVLLMAGLASTSAATASILLNGELVATVLLAALLVREHIGRWLGAGVALITLGGVVLTWQPGATVDTGALLVLAACACWGLDNVVTARIEQIRPEHVVLVKGVVAGAANLVIGLTVGGIGAGTTTLDVVTALAIGAAGYGLSITLWVQGARHLGASRAQAVFATSPFIGVAIAWVVLAEPVVGAQVVALVLAAAGVALSLRSGHGHVHLHAAVLHDHDHVHDEHHAHGGEPGRHSHRHEHQVVEHDHEHVPDLHHGHPHGEEG